MTDIKPSQHIPDRIDDPEDQHASHNVPPLVWVILAILVLVVAIAAMQHRGTHVTPEGRTMPIDSAAPVAQRSQ